jgi:pimeloyl-ACP methyl ester carboxylesterase
MINPSSVSTTAKAPNNSSKLLMKFINTPLIGTFLYNILTKETDVNSLLEEWFADPSEIDEKTRKIYYEAAHLGNAESKHLFASLKGDFLTANIPLYLEGLNNSIYIMNGGDLLEQDGVSKKYEELLPSIETVTIENSKHLPQLERPEQVLNYIDIFFE